MVLALSYNSSHISLQGRPIKLALDLLDGIVTNHQQHEFSTQGNHGQMIGEHKVWWLKIDNHHAHEIHPRQHQDFGVT